MNNDETIRITQLSTVNLPPYDPNDITSQLRNNSNYLVFWRTEEQKYYKISLKKIFEQSYEDFQIQIAQKQASFVNSNKSTFLEGRYFNNIIGTPQNSWLEASSGQWYKATDYPKIWEKLINSTNEKIVADYNTDFYAYQWVLNQNNNTFRCPLITGEEDELPGNGNNSDIYPIGQNYQESQPHFFKGTKNNDIYYEDDVNVISINPTNYFHNNPDTTENEIPFLGYNVIMYIRGSFNNTTWYSSNINRTYPSNYKGTPDISHDFSWMGNQFPGYFRFIKGNQFHRNESNEKNHLTVLSQKTFNLLDQQGTNNVVINQSFNLKYYEFGKMVMTPARAFTDFNGDFQYCSISAIRLVKNNSTLYFYIGD